MAKICVPVCVRHSDEMRDAIAAAVRVADMVELRADCLVDPQATLAFLHERALAIGRPLIVTMRSPEQGGRAEIDYEARRRFWSSLRNLPADSLIDLEFDLVNEYSTRESSGDMTLRECRTILKRYLSEWLQLLQESSRSPCKPTTLPIVFRSSSCWKELKLKAER